MKRNNWEEGHEVVSTSFQSLGGLVTVSLQLFYYCE